MTVLDRYVSREFLMTFGFVLLAFLCLYMLVDFFERIRMFLSNSATPGQIVASPGLSRLPTTKRPDCSWVYFAG